MIIYKATNKVNGKCYIGQTRGTLDARRERHLSCAKQGHNTHFYQAIRKYGEDAFEWEIVCEVDTKAELNYLETYFIGFYDSIRHGYNMVDGGNNNVMDIISVKDKHKAKMQSAETRAKLSATMKQKIADGKFFTPEHRQKLSKSATGNRNGENNISHSIPCYCLDKHLGRIDFNNYKDAGQWWFNTYHPFGDVYSQATYQRKIIDCIKTGKCRYKKPGHREVLITEDEIRWFRK